jgi:secondary thiamine-phosphate synthase enzyme
MKTKTSYLTLKTEKKVEIVHITDEVERVVRESGVKEGLVLVNPMHITSAVVVNDNESGLHSDYLRILEKLVPYRADYRHNDSGDVMDDDSSMSMLVFDASNTTGQRSRAHLAPDDGSPGRYGDNWGKTRSRSMGKDILFRIRRPEAETGVGQGPRRIARSAATRSIWFLVKTLEDLLSGGRLPTWVFRDAPAVLPQPSPPFEMVRDHVLDKRPEPRTMPPVYRVRQFVDDDIIQNALWHEQQPEIQAYRAAPGTASPPGRVVPDTDLFYLRLEMRVIDGTDPLEQSGHQRLYHPFPGES